MGQGEDLRKFILAALSASHRASGELRPVPPESSVFEAVPAWGMFLSPSRHDEIEYDVPCHLPRYRCSLTLPVFCV